MPRITPPNLAVVIGVDQLRADYLERCRPHFGEGSFKRLLAYNSPFTTETLRAFAQPALIEEKLGQHEATDLLAVSSLKSIPLATITDPTGYEVMDSVLRLDRVVAAFLDCIDSEVGLAHCVVVLTADHGVYPMPDDLAPTLSAVLGVPAPPQALGRKLF